MLFWGLLWRVAGENGEDGNVTTTIFHPTSLKTFTFGFIFEWWPNLLKQGKS